MGGRLGIEVAQGMGRALERENHRVSSGTLASMNLLWYTVLNTVQGDGHPTAAKNPADFFPHGGG